MSSASASYKKQDGILKVSKDRRTASWAPASSPAAPPAVTIAIADISNLQQSKEDSPKVQIRIVVQRPSATSTENYIFSFTSPTSARSEQVAITDVLRKAIEATRTTKDTPSATPKPDGWGQPAAMAVAQAVTAGARAEDTTYEDASLLENIELQKSLLNSNAALRKRFEEAIKQKPDVITFPQFSTQFWSTRVHLLRAHAAERSQERAAYHIIFTLKPDAEDGGSRRMKVTAEQIRIIFKLHPLVRRMYDELVPKLPDGEFWYRFFNSRLFKKLRGEEIKEEDEKDPKIDRYLDETDRGSEFTLDRVPLFMDLEGNEQNHSQRKGNRPDVDMRPENIPLVKSLNTMSEKLLADVAPFDAAPHAPVGMDEKTFRELELRDLERDGQDTRIMLKIKDQRKFFQSPDEQTSVEALLYSKQAPGWVLHTLKGDRNTGFVANNHFGGIGLERSIGVREDSDSEDERNEPQKKLRIGSNTARHAATSQIMGSIRQRRIHMDDFNAPIGTVAAIKAFNPGLSADVLDSLVMTHNTSVEFLHYFWAVFLSGDPERAMEASKLADTLKNSLERIRAVASAADEERSQEIRKERKKVEDYQRSTGKRRKFDAASIRGGAKGVNQLMAPLARAVEAAMAQYQTVYEAQLAQAQAQSTLQVGP